MRSAASSFRLSLTAAFFGAFLAPIQGCGESSTSAAFSADDDAGASTFGPGASPPELIGDASAGAQDAYRGSPLCHISHETCDPDDNGTASNYGGVACAVAPTDGGGTIANPKGCRLGIGSSRAPECRAATPENGDGAKCADGADCAPGFDCVAAPEGSVCRRYCCAGSCVDNRGQAGGSTFCDVQKLANGGAKAPVCMPIKSCKLFLQGECEDSETCAVVTEDGATGCVANGAALAGESCDEEHCNVGLTCLGQPGTRRCYQLCRTKGSPACGPAKTCQTSTIFKDPTIGVCADL